ncbi:ABC transporter substrate-binding protein [Alsobacter sp. SYSU BS001988]
MKILGAIILGLISTAALGAEPIRIANVVELSGVGASNGNNWKNAVTMAFDEINAKGGVLGRSLELTNYDTQTNPGVSRAQVQKALDAEPYVILGPIYSGSVKVNMGLAQQAEVPQIVGAQAAELTKMGNKFLFRTNLNQVDGLVKVSAYLQNVVKAKSVAMVWVNNDYGKQGRDAFAAEMKQRGIKLAAETSIENGQVDFAVDVLKVKDASPDAVLVYLNTEESAKFLREARRQNLDKPLIGETTLLNQTVIELAGPAANGIKGHISLSADAPFQTVADFRKRFVTRFGSVPDHNALAAYMAAYTVKAVTEKIGRVDGMAFAQALHGMTISPKDEPGILVECTWDQNGDVDFESLLGEVVDGKMKITETLPKLH